MKFRHDGIAVTTPPRGCPTVREPPLRANTALFVIPAKAGIHILAEWLYAGYSLPAIRRNQSENKKTKAKSKWIPSNPPSPVGSDTGMTINIPPVPSFRPHFGHRPRRDRSRPVPTKPTSPTSPWRGSNASQERAFALAIDEKHIGTQFLAHRSKLTPDKGLLKKSVKCFWVSIMHLNFTPPLRGSRRAKGVARSDSVGGHAAEKLPPPARLRASPSSC